ncbi:MAG: ATP-binding protein [Gemmataceae bacterium]
MNTADVMSTVREIWETKKAEGWTMERLGIAMGYPEKSARKSVSQFLKSQRPQHATVNRFMEAFGETLMDQTASPETTMPTTKLRELPYNPIRATVNRDEFAKRTIVGILESYNSNYDALAEAVQNSMDALEDASVDGLPGPYLLEITIDLKTNSITVLDTGVGMSEDQICEAFAPAATFKELNYAQSIFTKRGAKHAYRGYKGVGLTFLAYGTDDVWMHSVRNGEFVKARMRHGRQWVEGKNETVPMLEKDNASLGLDRYKRGTAIRLMFSANTRPANLYSLGASISIWEAIIRTRTAAGQVSLGRDALANIKVRLVLIKSDGTKEIRDVSPEFYYPHLVVRNPSFRFLDVWKYHQDNPSIGDIPASARRQDGIYLHWSMEEISRQIGSEKEAQFRDEINNHYPDLYAFRPNDWTRWAELNKIATDQNRTHFFSAGLVIAVDRQRLADITPIKASRWTYVADNTFVLFHFDKAKPDLGRKTIQSKLMELAQAAANSVVQYFANQNTFLKPAGERSTSAQRDIELQHEDWVDNVKGQAKDKPLRIEPVSYLSEPLTEQDVIGIFNQLCALGLFPGLKIFSTSAQHTYDCYIKFDYKGDLDRLRYKSISDNSLGLSSDVLPTDEKKFQTKGLTLEFKNNLEGLISDVEDPQKRKKFSNVDMLVCWGAATENRKGYHLIPIDENNLEERRFPGATHLLAKDDESPHVIQVVLLEEIVKRIQAGQIRLPQN